MELYYVTELPQPGTSNVITKTEILSSVVVGSARDQIRNECHDDGSRHASAKCLRECQKCLKNTRAGISHLCRRRGSFF